MIQFSPANTSDAFTTYDDNGLYFRTAPSDVLQGEVLGNLIAEDGNETLGMIVLNDSYGTGLAEVRHRGLRGRRWRGRRGSPPTTRVTRRFDAQIAEVLAADPDAIALITFDEVSTILPGLFGQFPADKLYFVDGNLKNFGDDVPRGHAHGRQGHLPGSLDRHASATSPASWTTFGRGEGKPELEDYSYAAESYDAVVLIALAALAAGSTDGADIAAKLQEVSGGSGDGEKCTTFADCAEIIVGGGVADYDGISGPITFDEVGDPTEASIGIYQYGEDNNYVGLRGLSSSHAARGPGLRTGALSLCLAWSDARRRARAPGRGTGAPACDTSPSACVGAKRRQGPRPRDRPGPSSCERCRSTSPSVPR